MIRYKNTTLLGMYDIMRNMMTPPPDEFIRAFSEKMSDQMNLMWQEGRIVGYSKGYKDGLEDGNEEGYDQGVRDANKPPSPKFGRD